MNTFFDGEREGTEPDKELVEEKQSEEVRSRGCEEACSWCAVMPRT